MPSGAFAAASPDAKVRALAAEVMGLAGVAEHNQETRISLFQDEFDDRMRALGSDAVEDAFEFSRKCGREDAIGEQQEVDAEADRHFRAMLAIPAATQVGRAAKVRTFLHHVGRREWRGDDERLDWPQSQVRVLLAEFAGLSAEEIANV